MAELGAFAPRQPRARSASSRARSGIERLYATGPLAARAAESFGAGARVVRRRAGARRGARAALGDAGADVRLLIKGSRVNRLERVVDALTGDARRGARRH